MSKEFILYLEPNLEFKEKVETFLKQSEKNYGFTTANKYGCHVTMTGFFKMKESTEIKRILDQLLNSMQFTTSPQVDSSSLLIYDENTHLPVHLLLPVTSTEEYRSALLKLAEECKHLVLLRLKKVNHISLAYWDEENATPIQHNQWQKSVSNGVFDKIKKAADTYFQHVIKPSQWDIVLYERVMKGDLVGQHHIFKELGRWPSG